MHDRRICLQCSVDGASSGDLGYSVPLLVGDVAFDQNTTADLLGAALRGRAIYAPMAALHRDGPYRPSFPPHIQEDRHGRSGAQRGQQQLVGVGPYVVAQVFGLVHDEGMTPGDDELLHVLQALDCNGLHVILSR